MVVPAGHELASAGPVTLEAVARYPIVTYDTSFTGRTAIDRSFAQRGLKPEIALTALDSDVIKSYVGLGLGVGIVSSMALGQAKEEGLVVLDAAHVFPTQTTRIAFRRNAWLRGYTVEFIRLFVPHSRAALEGLVAAAARTSHLGRPRRGPAWLRDVQRALAIHLARARVGEGNTEPARAPRPAPQAP